MKFPHSGLYHYCQNLGEHINKLLVETDQPLMRMYLPPRKKLSLNPQPYHLVEQKWHKLLQPFLLKCRVWHAPFQSGRILPDKKRFPNLKVVLTIHDLNVLHEGKPDDVQQKSLAHTQSLIDQSDAIICISEFTRNDVLTHCNVGEKPVHVIHNGVNKLPDVEATEASMYKPEREFVLGIGYLNQKKNFHVLLPLLESNPELELIIIGHHDDPDYAANMQQQALQLRVANRLHLLGMVSETAKIWYLQNCKALVHPSLAEGFGLTVIEAMQFGKPVFLSDRTSLPEVGGDAAFYFPSFEADAIQETFRQGMVAAECPERKKAIVQNAARFNWEKSAQEYLSVYQSIAG
ncbi:glycosyltransferase family 4 protein [Spirosoma gilvum]